MKSDADHHFPIGFTGREALRNRGAYTVIKIAHEAETDEEIGEHMIRLVALLKRDEGNDTQEDHLAPLEFGTESVEVGGNPSDEEEEADMEIEVI